MGIRDKKGRFLKGHGITPVMRKKMRLSHLGKKQSAETIKKRSEALKGNTWGFKKGHKLCVGRRLSPETRRRIGKANQGNKSHWNGGKVILKTGYVLIFSPQHPYRNNNNYVFGHRLVMEGYIGRFLLPGEVVHHINGVPDDNRIKNLILFPGQGCHLKHHKKERGVK